MPTLTEQETAAPPTLPITLPTVTYDPAKSLITAYLIVSACTSDSSGLCVQAPLIAIPGSGISGTASSWSVLWIVVPDASLSSASFDSKKVQVPLSGAPTGVGVTIPIPDLNPDQWQVAIQNSVPSAASIQYRVFVTGYVSDPKSMLATHHDPTIVVTMEPMG
jgi:hypothetical protein